MPDQDKTFDPPQKTGPGGKDSKHPQGKDAPDKEDRLDEGLEETFPASDPVAAHHIS